MNRRVVAIANLFALALVLLIVLPFAFMLLRNGLSSESTELSTQMVFPPLLLSLFVSGVSLFLSVLIGLPLAWFIARQKGAFKQFFRFLVMLPVFSPPLVAGVALLGFFGPDGAAGKLLAEFGIALPFSMTAMVIAATFVSAPFFVISLVSGIESLNPDLWDSVRTLGANRSRAIVLVLMPQLAPSFAAGMVLCWARAVGEFGATVVFAGNYSGLRTLPLELYHQFYSGNLDAAISLSSILLVFTLLIALALLLPGLIMKKRRVISPKKPA